MKQVIEDKENVIFAEVLFKFPMFSTMLSHLVIVRLGFRVETVSKESLMENWGEKECRRVGRSMCTYVGRASEAMRTKTSSEASRSSAPHNALRRWSSAFNYRSYSYS